MVVKQFETNIVRIRLKIVSWKQENLVASQPIRHKDFCLYWTSTATAAMNGREKTVWMARTIDSHKIYTFLRGSNKKGKDNLIHFHYYWHTLHVWVLVRMFNCLLVTSIHPKWNVNQPKWNNKKQKSSSNNTFQVVGSSWVCSWNSIRVLCEKWLKIQVIRNWFVYISFSWEFQFELYNKKSANCSSWS